MELKILKSIFSQKETTQRTTNRPIYTSMFSAIEIPQKIKTKAFLFKHVLILPLNKLHFQATLGEQ